MASYVKTKNGWKAYVKKKGLRTTKCFRTKVAAKAWATQQENELASVFNSSFKGTFGDILERYCTYITLKKPKPKNDNNTILRFLKDSIASIKAVEITKKHFAEFRDKRLEQIKPSSVRRELKLFSSICTTAYEEWEWLNHHPMKTLSLPASGEPRDRRPTEEEIQQICRTLGYAEGVPVILKTQLVAVFYLLAIETGMRSGELVWMNANKSCISIENRCITLLVTKNGTVRQVPLSPRALELVKVILQSDLSITDQSRDTLFRKARDYLKIKNLTFHDSRHEACTKLSDSLHILSLAKVTGHKDLRQLQVYYNPTVSELADQLAKATK